MHIEHVNMLDFNDKSDRNWCFSFGNLGAIFNGASAQHFPPRKEEWLIRLGKRSPAGQRRQRLLLRVWPVEFHHGLDLNSTGLVQSQVIGFRTLTLQSQGMVISQEAAFQFFVSPSETHHVVGLHIMRTLYRWIEWHSKRWRPL